MSVRVVIPAIEQAISTSDGAEKRALEALKAFVETGRRSAQKQAKSLFSTLGEPARRQFHFLAKQAAEHADSEERARAILDTANVRGFSNPSELAAAIRDGTVPRDKLDNLLLSAMHNGNWTMAKVLIKGGASLSARTKDKDSYTPLHYAIWYNHAGITRFLLKHGADPRTKTGSGTSALDLARERNCSNKVLRLLGRKSDGRRWWQFWRRSG